MSLAGCATLPIPGGKVVNRDYRPQILVTYAADGEVTPGVRYSLVQEGSALAFFEQTGAGAGTVLESHWTDAGGDHFAIWAMPVESATPWKRWFRSTAASPHIALCTRRGFTASAT
jgi:hypothetical protein